MNETNEIKLALAKEDQDNVESLYQDLFRCTRQNFQFGKYESHLTKIYDSFNLLLKSESNFFRMVNELKSELNDLSMRHAQALKLAEIDAQSKSRLVEELEKTSAEAIIAKTRETKTRETVNLLKLEIYNLSKLVEQGVGLSMGQEYNLRELLKEKENLKLENAKLVEDMIDLDRRLDTAKQRELELEQQANEHRLKATQVSSQLLSCQLEIQKLERKNEQLADDVHYQKKLNETKETNIARLNQTNQTFKLDSIVQFNRIAELEETLDKMNKDMEASKSKNQKLYSKLDEEIVRIDSLMIEKSQLVMQIKRQDEQIESLKFENVQLQKMRNQFEQKIKSLEDEKRALNNDKQALQNQLDSNIQLVENLKKGN